MRNIAALTFSIISSASACCASATESASDNFYVGGLYGHQNVSDTSVDFNTIGILGGYKFNEYLSVESRYLTGTSGYSRNYYTPGFSDQRYKEDLEWQASINLKASYHIYDQLKVYGLLGYTKTRLEYSGLWFSNYNPEDGTYANAHSYSKHRFEDGFNYGAGISYSLTDTVELFAEYQVLPKYSQNSWSNTSIGVNYHF